MDHKGKIALASLLGVIWAAVASWQWGARQEPARVPLTNVTGPAALTQQGRAKAGGLRVNLELLNAAGTPRESAFTAPRNIFAVPRPDGTLPVGSEIIAPAPAEPASEQEARQQAVAAELAQYRYLGYLRLGEARKKVKDVAVLSKNEEVLAVKVGERIEDHLVLKAITPESVTIRDTGAQVEHTVPLSEEPPGQNPAGGP
jgi:hypothetical protein